MKIAFVSVDDHSNYKSWSGLKLNIFKALKKISKEVYVLPVLPWYFKIFFKLKRNIFKIFGVKFDSERVVYLSKIYSKILEKKLQEINPDIIFTSDSYAISFLKTKIPIYIWTDATFDAYYNHYFLNQKIHKDTIKEGNLLDKIAFQKAKKIFFTSDWAISNCKKKYKIESKKIFYLPFGSNLKNNYKKKYIINKIEKKSKSKICSLISIGVDWERKGMTYSYEVLKNLKNLNIKSELTIIGPKRLPNKFKNRKDIKFHKFMNKNKNGINSKISNILLNSHFHLLFSKSEAYGVVFAEASSLGLYNFCFNIGGTGGIVINNINGFRFANKTHPAQVAKKIKKIFCNRKLYIKLSKSSLNIQRHQFSWKKISLKLKKYLK